MNIPESALGPLGPPTDLSGLPRQALLEAIKKLSIQYYEAIGSAEPTTDFVELLRPIQNSISAVARDATQTVTERRQTEPLKYQFINFESLLNEAGQLLNRCDSARRDADAVAMTAMTNAYGRTLKALQRMASQKSLVAEFGPEVTNNSLILQPIQPGDVIAAPQPPPPALAKARVQYRYLVDEGDLDEAYWKAASDPDSVLDFAFQYLRLGNFLKQDIEEAYERLLAVQVGMLSRGGSVAAWASTNPLPPPSLSILEELILWSRAALIQIELRNCRRYETYLGLEIAKEPSDTAVLSGAEFSAAMTLSPAVFSFQVHGEKFPGKFPVLNGVGVVLKFSSGRLQKQEDRTMRFPVSLTLPAESGIAVSGRISEVPAVTIEMGSTGLLTEAVSYPEITGPTISNRSPLGAWQVRIGDDGFGALGAGKRNDYVVGLTVMLRVSYEVNEDAG